MNTAWFIAKRYLESHRRNGFLSFITSIAIIGVMLGTAALIITLTVLDGFEKEIKDKVIAFTSHIEVRGYQNIPVTNYKESIQKVKHQIAGVEDIAPFAAREGMIRSSESIDGIFLKGIDPASQVLTSHQHIISGRYIDVARRDKPQIVIGKKLANRLNVNVGDKLVVFALPQSKGLQPLAKQFELVGIYESGMAEFDDINAYTNMADAQQLFQMGENISGYDITVHDITKVDEVAAQVQSLLGYPHYARTVFQLYRNLFSWVELQKKMSPILLSLIIMVATVNIIGTLLMFVLEKTHAIGILKSLGAGPKLVKNIFRLQGLLISIIGISLGNLLAFVICWLQLKFKILSLPSDIYYMDTVPMMLRWENFVFVSLVALLLCMLTTILPSRSASKLDSVTALRFG
ncbi:MAG: ABC transporter permease [Ignavibacteriales bacterium]|nr:ABC transporter permease [Ignavibacteriales bacterium]